MKVKFDGSKAPVSVALKEDSEGGFDVMVDGYYVLYISPKGTVSRIAGVPRRLGLTVDSYGRIVDETSD